MMKIQYISVILLTSSILAIPVFLISSNVISDSNAQTMNSTNEIMDKTKKNWTGSIEMMSVIRNSFDPLINVSLAQSIGKAEEDAGEEASGVAAFMHPVNGYLTYIVYTLNSQNQVTKYIIDAGNGKILEKQGMTIEQMMFAFHHGGMKSGHGMYGSDNMMKAQKMMEIK